VKKALYAVLGLSITLGAAAMAQQKAGAGADEGTIRALEEKWDTANLKGDAAALDAIFADSFITTDAEGKVRTKAEVLAALKSGDVKYQSAKADEIKVYLNGDTAIVSGRWQGKFTEKGKPMDVKERFTDTFVKRNGQWRCLASHGSTLKSK
jgi:ketosteroid isomerase-like protein